MYSVAQWLESTRLTVGIQSAGWAIPLVQSIHIMAIGIVFVSILMIVLRLMGWMRTDQPFGEVAGFFAPWIRRGLVVLTLTGLTLVIGEPIREIMSLSFWLKMALLVIAVASGTAFYRSLGSAGAVGGPELKPTAAMKSAAMATVLLWLAIIFLGRAIAYDVEVWGALSLAPRA
jgi:hypothetical protein